MSLSGGPPLTFENLKNTALTSTTIVVNTAIWFYLWNFNVNIEKFGYQYEKVVQGKELWRFFSASYAHVHPLHLVFNMASLWNASIMEVYLGHMIYAKYTFILVVLSMATVTVFYYVMIRYFERPHYRHLYSLGYSCVVFGWMMIQCEYFGGHMSYFGLVIPARLSPFLALIITSIIVPRASFIGHLSGIIIGELISRGVFDWFIDYLFLVCVALTGGAALWTFFRRANIMNGIGSPSAVSAQPISYTRDTRRGGSYFYSGVSRDSSGDIETRPGEIKIVNGVLVRSPDL